MTDAGFGIAGLHRVSCVASDALRTLKFYGDILGMRAARDRNDAELHFDIGDAADAWPTLTFRIDPAADQGCHGGGQVGSLALTIPRGSLGLWRQRLVRLQCDVVGRAWAFDDEYLYFVDPDGLALFLVEERGVGATEQATGPAKSMPSIKGVFAVELDSLEPAQTARLLVDALGLVAGPNAGPIGRFYSGTLAVDVLSNKHRPGSHGLGVIEHVAWRVPDQKTMGVLVERLRGIPGVELRPRHDGLAFFREAGGTCFALALDERCR
ncbi:VOC family protein [Beijerinckia sp. L45]|uniref:VOC family protein n=1 Tax=Beijerinckia sp. L45 TaxID=1641855 RepID=UPI00131B8F5F|nr:VOC family protein [Beijerinckia sp. L45]